MKLFFSLLLSSLLYSIKLGEIVGAAADGRGRFHPELELYVRKVAWQLQ